MERGPIGRGQPEAEGCHGSAFEWVSEVRTGWQVLLHGRSKLRFREPVLRGNVASYSRAGVAASHAERGPGMLRKRARSRVSAEPCTARGRCRCRR